MIAAKKAKRLRRFFRSEGITIPTWLRPPPARNPRRAACQKRYEARRQALAWGQPVSAWCQLQPHVYPGRPITSTHPRAAYWREWKRAKRRDALACNDITHWQSMAEKMGASRVDFAKPRSGNPDLIRKDA